MLIYMFITVGAAKDKSTVKKKALLDVGNTIHKNILQSTSKQSISAKTTAKKDLIKVFGDKENANVNKKLMTPKETKQNHILSEAIADPNLKEHNVVPFCNCYDQGEGKMI